MTIVHNTTFKALQKSFQEGRLIPFVGAGFSMTDPEAPDWKGVIDEIATAYNVKQKTVMDDLKDHLERAEYLQKVWEKKVWADEETKGKNSIEEILKEKFRSLPSKKANLEPHRKILEHFDRIYTTNYDKYFETAARSEFTIQNVPHFGERSSSSKYITRNTSSNRTQCTGTIPCNSHTKARRLIKYHGDYRIPGSMILTETSYFQRLQNLDAKDILFSGDALFYDFLFLGYNFDDISLKYTLQQLERTFETLGKASGNGMSKHKKRFFILRTTDAPRNKYQDEVYKLRSINMSEFALDGFEKDGCSLTLFRSDKGQQLRVDGSDVKLEFSSFSAVWNGAGSNFCDTSKCEGKKCKKLHLSTALLSKEDKVAKAAKQFRAQVLSKGYTEFLNQLTS